MASLIELVKELRERTNAGFADCKKALEASENDIEKAIDWLREKGIAKSASKASRVAAEGIAKVVVEGNTAVLVEVNAETDFSAKNDLFKNLVDLAAQTILANKPADVDAALACATSQGTLSEAIAQVSFQTGEKMTLRRFEIVNKTDAQTFGTYMHFDGKKACLVVLNGDNAEAAKNIAMQVVSMVPQVVDRDHLSAEVVERERNIIMTQMSEDPANASKPENILAKMAEGRLNKALKGYTLVDQDYILDGSMSVAGYLKSVNCSVDSFVRYTVGEGIEKKKDNWVEEVMAAQKA